MNSPDPVVRERTAEDTHARIQARAEELILYSEDEMIGLQIERLGRKIYPSMSPFLLTHYLVDGFTARPPEP